MKLKNAYIDWMVPQTDLKVRMGIQGVALPSMTTGSNVFNDDVAGVVASYQFNETWASPLSGLAPLTIISKAGMRMATARL